ncbi:hypothetical protein M2451_000858 [Dysgonomonas sp. PFB1-18]|uniref:DUF6377 domain-containing protein n=1 Tax=unclassified Dysgonomonas TaxID=2630389 RepID=UPI002475E9D0|nr:MULTISPECIES: DUF6377 domain-containing protein [unclassified Dysgonomonas]MDH6308547.1 hypothetical protein [Dysgonomonas sp. PF1-14]MDH6338048.1 hypothetical protein [Dysgonomonas sp. PF1-16]MDH6379545.1 hypothetical protein [Dysgonomonas sp. PFB1-18]MDH6396875.1 hypothetical protein [Dysgonomonas sp. PF1-23]
MQQKYISGLFLLLFCCINVFGQQSNQYLLKELDEIIGNRTQYVRQKEDKIDYLKKLSSAEASPVRKIDIQSQLIEEYSNYQADSAFHYIGINRRLQEKNNLEQLQSRFQYAFICAQSGLFNESQLCLDSLRKEISSMTTTQRAEYYKLYERLYMNLREYAKGSHLEDVYGKLELAYCDSILAYVSHNSQFYHYYKFKAEYIGQDFDAAESSIKKYMELTDSVSNDAARGYYQLSNICKERGDTINEIRYLILSVFADEKSAVRQNRSMRLLAQILYAQGDIKRAYRYLQISSDDANFYNTRLRNSQIAEVLPIIEKDYQSERDENESRLRLGIILISILLVIIIAISIYLRKKLKQLSSVRKDLMVINKNLSAINEEVKEKNEALGKLAFDLGESDSVKEKYVGYFLKLCSTYIQKISEYQKLVNRKIKAGQIDDLYKMTSSDKYLLQETKEFYKNFDEAFLNIYPSFVQDFNSLLQDDKPFSLKEGELLNTELRIYALIRLGIKESSQIAEFMGYTPVTIYSYRTKVKSKAKDKENFDRDILKTGRSYFTS